MRSLPPRKRTWSTRVFCGSFHFHDRLPGFVSFSFSLRLSSICDDVKLIGEERDHFCNNTSADVSGCIESITRDRNEIANPNTFAMEDFFLKHDDNDRGKRSTLSKYCEGADTFSIIRIRYTVARSIRVLEFY